ncbi:hypothetical protein [Nostoc commune]|nr:hypothetical protein [Nostoc commune]
MNQFDDPELQLVSEIQGILRVSLLFIHTSEIEITNQMPDH